jgi:hypothetical protein
VTVDENAAADRSDGDSNIVLNSVQVGDRYPWQPDDPQDQHANDDDNNAIDGTPAAALLRSSTATSSTSSQGGGRVGVTESTATGEYSDR